MEDIIVINDDSQESLHAAKYAFNLACFYNKNIVLANVISSRPTVLDKVAPSIAVPAGFEVILADDETPDGLTDHLNCFKSNSGFQPEIRTLDASNYGEREMITYINTQRTWMIVQGATSNPDMRRSDIRINLQSIINRIQCPVMLVPETTPVAAPERLVYLADLRYSQIPVINYLAKFKAQGESIILAHVCAKGLPELEKSYANDLFTNGLSTRTVCSNLYFIQLREKQFADVIDTVIHGMQADLLVCCNHSYQFEQLLGNTLTPYISEYVPVPVLVFPY